MNGVLRFFWRFAIGYFVTLLVIFVTQFTYFSYIDRFTPPELLQPFPVLNENQEVELGGSLTLEISFRKVDPIYVTSSRQVLCESGDILALENNTTQLPITEELRTVNVNIPIPDSDRVATPQQCIYQVRGTGQINSYRTYLIELVSEPFTLIRGE